MLGEQLEIAKVPYLVDSPLREGRGFLLRRVYHFQVNSSMDEEDPRGDRNFTGEDRNHVFNWHDELV